MNQQANSPTSGALSEPIRGKRAMTRREIWWEASTRNAPWRHHMAGAWFWQDEDCEEPMGPFESRGEAIDDYREVRGLAPRTLPSPDGSAKR